MADDSQPESETAPPRPVLASPAERRRAGKAARARIDRKAHGVWEPHRQRGDPVAALQASDRERRAELVGIRYGRMLESPFTFFRGAAGLMAADLAGAPDTGLAVQACGDCHLLNFGGFLTPERRLIFDLNDFDETSRAPWEWDVKRLAVSFVLAARANGLGESNGVAAAAACVASYRKRIREFAELDPLAAWYLALDVDSARATDHGTEAMRESLRRDAAKATKIPGSQRDLPRLTRQTGGRFEILEQPPKLYHPPEKQQAGFDAMVASVFSGYRRSLPEERRVLIDRYRIVDAAIKVVGIGSVGRHCWIGLLMSAADQPLFLQFKEAQRSVLEPYAGRNAHRHAGKRVVIGQKLMQPASDVFLGWATAPGGRQYYARQLRDGKIKPRVEDYDAERLSLYAEACGLVLARAHAKGGEPHAIAAYIGKADVFETAIAAFALAYADQCEADHAALLAAARSGRVEAIMGA